MAPGLQWAARGISAIALLCGAALLLSCEEPTPPPPKTSDELAEQSDPLAITAKKKRVQPSLQDLGAKGRRVKVIVVPGDASVEVDGFGAKRRNGVIELTGRVGDVHRLRVYKGAEQLEQDVTIEEAGVSPAVLDLAAHVLKQGGGDEGVAAPAKKVDPLFVEEFQ
jgi:hypothetical protein